VKNLKTVQQQVWWHTYKFLPLSHKLGMEHLNLLERFFKLGITTT